MLTSIKNLLQTEFNKQHPFFALKRFLQWKHIRLRKLNDVKYALWDDRQIYLNHDSFQSMWIMYNYIVDWEEFNFIKRFVKPQDQLFDVGANMGFYTIWMSKFVGPRGGIHSFEPDSVNFKRLTKNAELNKLENTATLNNSAVSDVDGFFNFTTGLDGENHLSGTITTTDVKVETQTLQTYVNKHGIKEISYLKIDVEGFEFSVLSGAENLLKTKAIKVLQLEVNKALSNSGKSVSDVLNILKANEYILCRYMVKENKLVPMDYSPERENYFAVSNLKSINNTLSTGN